MTAAKARARPTVTEAEVLKACLRLLELRGVLAWRNNTGAHATEGRFIRYGKVGSSDILAVGPGGRLMALEIKRPGGKPTAAQRAFLDAVNAAGGYAVVIDDVRQLDLVLDALAINPRAVAGLPGGNSC